MSTPFYVSPEQFMKDRADYARKGIARGRSVVVIAYADGVLFATETPSRALHKISEIYDRIAFAAVGKYHEFESLRVAGIRYADMRGYTYDRADVSVRGLANAYAQTLGSVFTADSKPFEVEIVVAEIGDSSQSDQLYRLSYDGSLGEERHHVVIGGQAEELSAVVAQGWRPELSFAEALDLALTVLSHRGEGEPADVSADSLEVAVLDRQRPRRAFRRIARDSDELRDAVSRG